MLFPFSKEPCYLLVDVVARFGGSVTAKRSADIFLDSFNGSRVIDAGSLTAENLERGNSVNDKRCFADR